MNWLKPRPSSPYAASGPAWPLQQQHFVLEEEITDVKNVLNEAINRMDDVQDRFIEEHMARLSAESNLAIAMQALRHACWVAWDSRYCCGSAVLQELDELSAAVQVADQFIGIGVDSTWKLEQLGCLPVTQARLLQPRDMWAAVDGASWGSATQEQFAVSPQAADAAIAARVAATRPAARISMAIMDIQGYNR